jgi:predicted RNA-binding protein YlxR (DUF448 family)
MADPQPKQPKTHAEASRERRDIVSNTVMPEARLIRFVAGPDGQVVPDLAAALPGRGMWVEATREAVEAAAKRGAFARSAKAKLTADAKLADQVEALIARRCLDRLGLARRAGALTTGFESVEKAIRSGKAAWLIEACDGSADGRGKLLNLARHQTPPPRLCGAFSVDELSLATGMGNVIHSAFLAGRWAERWTEEAQRLSGFRQLLPLSWSLPPSWGEEA